MSARFLANSAPARGKRPLPVILISIAALLGSAAIAKRVVGVLPQLVTAKAGPSALEMFDATLDLLALGSQVLFFVALLRMSRSAIALYAFYIGVFCLRTLLYLWREGVSVPTIASVIVPLVLASAILTYLLRLRRDGLLTGR